MVTSRFFKMLLSAVLLSAVLVFGTGMLLPITAHAGFIILSLLFFTGFTVMIYFLAKRPARPGQGERFLFIVVLNVFIKLFAAFALVFLYARFGEPENKWFVLPFLEIYLVFTVLETWFLSAQAKLKH